MTSTKTYLLSVLLYLVFSPAFAAQGSMTIVNDWGSGFQAEVTVTNDGTTTLSNWTAEFDMAVEIGSIWNGELQSSSGGHFVIGPTGWNADIAPGDSTAFGFTAAPGNLSAVSVAVSGDGGAGSNSSSSSTSSSSSSTSSSSSSSGGCTPTAITPYLRVDGGDWQQTAEVTISAGSTLQFGPHPVSGSWSWSGCGTSGSLREQTVSLVSSCTATATYINSCGAQSTLDFPVTVESGGSTETLIEENTTGFCGVDGTIDNNHAGFTGSGFANADNSLGASVDYSVDADHATSATLDVRFASASNRPASIEVNGFVAGTVNFNSTDSWTNWANESITVALQAGENTIRLVPQTADGLPNVDSLTLVGSGLNPGACNAVPDSCNDMNGDGDSLLSCSGDPAVCLLGGGVGSYRVAMRFDTGYSGDLEVFAESRRRMFTSPQQSASADRCVDFLVDVRDPEGEPYQSDHGTSGLNLRITKGTGALTALSASPVTSPRTLFIAGDSTVADQLPQLWAPAESRYTGWGQFIPAYFGNDISISNYADSGEGTAAFRTDGGGLWNRINARLNPGDWVMIQLGHNDKTTSGSLYRSRITNMVTAIRSKGANPILITPMIRNTGDPLSAQHIWGDLNIRNELIGVANAQNVPLIDLMKLSSEWAERIGRSAAQAYFVDNDRTHSNEMGAELFAQMIVSELRQQNIGIIDYLRNP
ncbi:MULTISPECIES: cellulose binding domain-containing protein [unclassified Microbulbifer]|uniref:cellulose binding domain-containing protein n=1 Tax=unclassified Microbulbifer TaxID=2619833 RepID=UPI0027E52002|nr:MULTISPECIES: cellulose binding domain-containing protein [unclassified Microbulbifer]